MATAQRIDSPRAPAPRTLPGRGNWWVQPVAVAIGFTLFVIYSFFSVAIYQVHHVAGPYLSPYYSPVIHPGWISGWFSPAFLVAWIPLGFRATCYYYRKAYYRAFFWDPPACAIREPSARPHYKGETAFPWILNNLHRFFLYLAIIVLAFLWWDTINAFRYTHGLYIGVGSVLMLVNVILISGYTFSCHALRHLVGGNINCFSCSRSRQVRHGLWGFVSKLNPYHPTWAWFSLTSVAATDIYIRVVSNVGSCFGYHTGC